MTEFLDLLEMQLADAAHRRRSRPRLRLRGINVEALALTGAVAAGVALIVALSGGSTKTHDAHTPAAPTAAAANVTGLRIAIASTPKLADRAGEIADRLADAGARVVGIEHDLDQELDFTEIAYRGTHAADALAVSRFVGGIDERDAALRILPGERIVGTDVIVRVGRADHFGDFQLRADQSSLTFSRGCHPDIRPLSAWDAHEAAFAVLHHWPKEDGAVLSGNPVVADKCGVRASAIVPVVLTRTGETLSVFVSCARDHWVIWRQL